MRTHSSAAAVAAIVLLAAFGCGGPEERKAEYLARAQDYIHDGNFPKARVALRNVLKIDPKDPEAYFFFAEVEEKEQNWRNAFANYQRTVELRPDHERALIKLAKFFLELRFLGLCLFHLFGLQLCGSERGACYVWGAGGHHGCDKQKRNVLHIHSALQERAGCMLFRAARVATAGRRGDLPSYADLFRTRGNCALWVRSTRVLRPPRLAEAHLAACFRPNPSRTRHRAVIHFD